MRRPTNSPPARRPSDEAASTGRHGPWSKLRPNRFQPVWRLSAEPGAARWRHDGGREFPIKPLVAGQRSGAGGCLFAEPLFMPRPT
jgi:hypothetical protein